jgi:hypothetical protein
MCNRPDDSVGRTVFRESGVRVPYMLRHLNINMLIRIHVELEVTVCIYAITDKHFSAHKLNVFNCF